MIDLLIAFAVWGMTACKPGLLPTEEAGKPKVTLERVEVMSYFPWADLPARTPLALGYVFNIDNPSGSNIKLDNFKFTVFFEAAPGQYLSNHHPHDLRQDLFPTQDGQPVSNRRCPGFVHDQFEPGWSPMRQRSRSFNLNRAEVIKNWYTKIGDFAFGIKVAEGMAVFSSEKGDLFVPFEGKFPKK